MHQSQVCSQVLLLLVQVNLCGGCTHMQYMLILKVTGFFSQGPSALELPEDLRLQNFKSPLKMNL